MLAFLNLSSLYALPIGNPADASLLTKGIFWERSQECDLGWSDWFNVRFGFYGDYVFNRHLEQRENRRGIASTRFFTNSGFWALNFRDKIDLFGTLGATGFRFETRTANFAEVNNIPVFIETQTHLSWSVGLKGTLWQCRGLFLGLEGQYFQTRPDLRFVRTESFPATFVDDVDLDYREWQVGAGTTYRIPLAVGTALFPYIAVSLSRVRVNVHHASVDIPVAGPITLFNLKNANHWGYAVGLTLVGNNRVNVTVEGRFADEKACSVNGQFSF